MRILLAHKFFHLTGGAEVFFFETGRVLENNGHDVAYFSTDDKNNKTSRYSSYFVKAPNYKSGSFLKRVSSIGRMIYSTEAKKRFMQLLEDFKPDIVHVFAINVHLTPSILDACKKTGVPVVMSCNDYKHICPNYKLFHHGHVCEDCKGGDFYHAVKNRCCKSSFVFSVASAIEAYFHKAWDIYRKNIHTFLFASEFMARKTEEFWGSDTFEWRMLRNPFNSLEYPLSKQYDNFFLFFGRLIDEKGVNVLLDAMRIVKEAKLVVVGDGPEREKLEDLSADLKINNVRFVGPKWGDELDRLLQSARFVVVPSIWHENFPYVILQSFAVGKAVIGTDLGGIPEIVRDGEFGFIYPSKDSYALSQHIQNLWGDPSLPISMGKMAKAYVNQEFNDEKFYQNLMEIYKDILS